MAPVAGNPQAQNRPVRTRESEKPPRAAEPAEPFYLSVQGSARVLTLEQPRCTIGTAGDNSLVLEDPYVSKYHCALVRARGVVWIHDQGSRNGTWVNHVRVDRCQLGDGARIVVGRTSMQVVSKPQSEPEFGIVGESEAMRRVGEQLVRLGASMRPVLIQGETGTGKELIARALHQSSPCRPGPYEPLNCGAIPRELAEAELFGHVPGAFTGATRERRGAFERASGGTLFLDEIGEMPVELQPKILRVLEDGVVQRIGEEQRRPVNVRVIAATHRDLLVEAERGRFRLDLFHRVAVGVITLPPLRERADDIPILARHFLQQSSPPGVALEIDPAAEAILRGRLWGGNVRELRNAIHRAVLCSPGKNVLGPEEFAFLQGDRGAPPGAGLVCVGRTFREIRREVYLKNLQAYGGNRSAAALALGIPKSTFFDQLRDLGI